MYVLYISITLFICLLAFLGTLLVGKQVNQSIRQREREGESTVAELEEKQNYKNSSSIKMLSLIYIITFLLTAIVIAIFIL